MRTFYRELEDCTALKIVAGGTVWCLDVLSNGRTRQYHWHLCEQDLANFVDTQLWTELT